MGFVSTLLAEMPLYAADHAAWAFWALLLATFLLEDVATVAGAMLAVNGTMLPSVVILALFIGIFFGDLLLYFIGRMARKLAWLRRWTVAKSGRNLRKWLGKRVEMSVFFARFLPGARIPTFAISGLLKISLRRFALAVGAAAILWTGTLFTVVYATGNAIPASMGWVRWLCAFAIAMGIGQIGKVIAKKLNGAA